ncbi:hypothetical protein AS9A_2695 [Hoyosella subflava DQS3-9A1]|uniref:Septum formation-related domain-containing protein n=1 Tax=Hoyosella subflava (strain DSM 45089 / JCM 17490 / NBRC 109087 / DQS3-9A1) TaxID=443218 RepID=F6EHG3_HOYSD|nr:hypothetical protein AS9A_2695 [Hoyosella subflava DQS3-9A1]
MLAAAPLAAISCSAGGGDATDDAEPTSPGAATAEHDAGTREVSEFDVQVGDCLLGPEEASTPGTVAVVPCDEPHQQEIFAIYQLDGTEFPGDNEVQETARDGCRDEFQAFTGTEEESSKYVLNFLYPTEVTWAGGDREVVCMILDPDGPVSGSLRDVGE